LELGCPILADAHDRLVVSCCLIDVLFLFGMPHHSSDSSASDAALIVPVKFDSVVLVCGDCEKRSNGPSRLSAKEVRKDLKHRLADAPHRFRVVQSTCLGLCPKKAIAVAAIPAGKPLLVVELKSDADTAQLASLLLKSK